MLAVVYVDVMRGVPTILMVFPIGFGVPFGCWDWSGLPTNPAVLGGAALALCYSAYVSEVFRAGIESVHPSQAAGRLALGLDPDSGASLRDRPAGGSGGSHSAAAE